VCVCGESRDVRSMGDIPGLSECSQFNDTVDQVTGRVYGQQKFCANYPCKSFLLKTDEEEN